MRQTLRAANPARGTWPGRQSLLPSVDCDEGIESVRATDPKCVRTAKGACVFDALVSAVHKCNEPSEPRACRWF